jgi:iron complex transport system ATP-binding protein
MTDAVSTPVAAARKPWELDCHELSVRRGGRVVLSGVNLSLRAGECLSLIGPNGSGKTTLMLTLLGLLRPAAGSVRLDGAAVYAIAARRRGRWAAYVPQTVGDMPPYSVLDVVAAGRYPHVAPLMPLSRRDREIMDDALRRCGLSELAERPVQSLSGGERQKALLAAAIAQDAEVLFLDEPDTALDPAYVIELVGLLRDWLNRGRGLVLISHDLQLPAALGGRVVALRGGRMVEDSEAARVLAPDILRCVYGAEFDRLIAESGRCVLLPHLPHGR